MSMKNRVFWQTNRLGLSAFTERAFIIPDYLVGDDNGPENGGRSGITAPKGAYR